MKSMQTISLFFILLILASSSAEALAYGIAVSTDPKGSTNVYRNAAESSPVLTKVGKGELFLVISKEGDWYQVFALDNTIGYIHKKNVTIRWNDGKGIGIIADTEGFASLRSGPSNNYPEKQRLGEDIMFIIIGKGSWYKVLTRNQAEGWVLAGKVVEIWPMEKQFVTREARQ